MKGKEGRAGGGQLREGSVDQLNRPAAVRASLPFPTRPTPPHQVAGILNALRGLAEPALSDICTFGKGRGKVEETRQNIGGGFLPAMGACRDSA